MEEQLDELEEQLREQLLEFLSVEQERRGASEAMQEQLEVEQQAQAQPMAIHHRWRISVLHVLKILFVFLK